MKKIIFASTFAATVFAGIAVSTSQAYAVTETADANTTGDVTFGVSTTRPETIKPGTNDPIIPENKIGNTSANNVWLLHAPSFNFGTQTINTSEDTEYAVKNSTYKKSGNTTDDFEIPQFLQVADNSGKKGTTWSVTAYQDAAFASGTGASASTLTNARIRFYGQTLTNNVRTAAQIPDAITGFTNDSGASYKTLPVGQANATAVLTSKADTTDAKTTSGTTSSLVFKNAYSEADYGTAKAAATVTERANNTDVKLFVPYADTPQKLDYTAKIVWTLTATPATTPTP